MPRPGAASRSRPSGADKVADLMYDRWVEQNARRVAELSKGKLGYIHIPSMDEAGLDRFVRSLYSDNFDKEAIVLDVRYNGGGFTHDQVLNYLGAKEHTFFRQRDGGEGLVLRSYDRKWTKPLVLLINNRSYSDAEIFPSAFRTLGLGKLVGQPTGGHVIGTSSVRLIDGSTFRVPRIGVFTLKGVNMEKAGRRARRPGGASTPTSWPRDRIRSSTRPWRCYFKTWSSGKRPIRKWPSEPRTRRTRSQGLLQRRPPRASNGGLRLPPLAVSRSGNPAQPWNAPDLKGPRGVPTGGGTQIARRWR